MENSTTERGGRKRRRRGPRGQPGRPAGTAMFRGVEDFICAVAEGGTVRAAVARIGDRVAEDPQILTKEDCGQLAALSHNLLLLAMYRGAVPSASMLLPLRRVGDGSVLWAHELLKELGLSVTIYTCALERGHGGAPCPACRWMDSIGDDAAVAAPLWVGSLSDEEDPSHLYILGNAPV